MRGLVVSVPMAIEGSSLQIYTTDLDRQELRSNLLFWDKLDFPQNNVLGLGLSPDAEFLEKAGILKRTMVQFRGSGDMAQIVLDCHLRAFEFLSQQQPGNWSLAVGERSISFPNSELESGRGALVRLYNAVPVPNEDVSLADLLNFKEKRRSELLSLRHHLEGIYQRIISSGDGPLAWNTEVEALQKSILDHLKTTRETSFKWRMFDLSASINLAGPIVGGITAHIEGLPLAGGIITGLVAGISVDASSGLKKKEASATPFRYISAYHKELF